MKKEAWKWRKLLEEVEPVICEIGPEPTVYEIIVSYYLERFGESSKAEAHRCASKYIDELLKLADHVRWSENWPLPGLVTEEEKAVKFWAAERERLTMNGKPK
jgi:hypothetical protein